MATTATKVSAKTPHISLGPEIDMSLLNELVEKYSHRPEDSFTVKEFAEKADISENTANKHLLELVRNGELRRMRVKGELGVWEYVYYEKEK